MIQLQGRFTKLTSGCKDFGLVDRIGNFLDPVRSLVGDSTPGKFQQRVERLFGAGSFQERFRLVDCQLNEFS